MPESCPTPSTLNCQCVGGQLDVGCCEAGEWPYIRVRAQLLGAGASPIIDPSNCAVVAETEVVLDYEGTNGCWCTCPLKPNEADDPNDALTPSGTYWRITILTSATGAEGTFQPVVGPYDVTLNADTVYDNPSEPADDCCMIEGPCGPCVNFTCLLPPNATEPPTNIFCAAVAGCLNPITGSGLLAGNVTGNYTEDGWTIDLTCDDLYTCFTDPTSTGGTLDISGDYASGFNFDVKPISFVTNGNSGGVTQSGPFGNVLDVLTISTDTGNLVEEGTDGGNLVTPTSVRDALNFAYVDADSDHEAGDTFVGDGSPGAPFQIPVQTALVVTTDGNTAGVTQDGVDDHTLDLTVLSTDADNLAESGSDGGVKITCVAFEPCMDAHLEANLNASGNITKTVDPVTGAVTLGYVDVPTGLSSFSATPQPDGSITVAIALTNGDTGSVNLPAPPADNFVTGQTTTQVVQPDGSILVTLTTTMSESADLVTTHVIPPNTVDTDTWITPTSTNIDLANGTVEWNYVDQNGAAQTLTDTFTPPPDLNTTNVSVAYNAATDTFTITDSDGNPLSVVIDELSADPLNQLRNGTDSKHYVPPQTVKICTLGPASPAMEDHWQDPEEGGSAVVPGGQEYYSIDVAFTGVDADGYPLHPNAPDSAGMASNRAGTTNPAAVNTSPADPIWGNDQAMAYGYIWLDQPRELVVQSWGQRSHRVYLGACDGPMSLISDWHHNSAASAVEPIGVYAAGLYQYRAYVYDPHQNGTVEIRWVDDVGNDQRFNPGDGNLFGALPSVTSRNALRLLDGTIVETDGSAVTLTNRDQVVNLDEDCPTFCGQPVPEDVCFALDDCGLESLGNVDAGAVDGDTIIFNDTTGMWEPGTISSGTTFACTLLNSCDVEDLGNVTGSPTTGQVMTFNGTNWAPATAAGVEVTNLAIQSDNTNAATGVRTLTVRLTEEDDSDGDPTTHDVAMVFQPDTICERMDWSYDKYCDDPSCVTPKVVLRDGTINVAAIAAADVSDGNEAWQIKVNGSTVSTVTLGSGQGSVMDGTVSAAVTAGDVVTVEPTGTEPANPSGCGSIQLQVCSVVA